MLSPPDYQQGDGYRIIYVHAATTTLSLTVYTVMAIAAAVALIWRIKVANAVAASRAPLGVSFTVVALLTGMLWGIERKKRCGLTPNRWASCRAG